MKFLILLLSLAIFSFTVFSGPEEELAESIDRGKVIYVENCITCHMGNGDGAPGTFPPLAKSDYLTKNPEKAIYAVKFGLTGKIQVNGTEYNSMMPPPGLDNNEIADVMNYIRNSWGNSSDKKIVTEKMVEEIEE
ncbi:cytochrome c [Dyadobacter luteus]|uniref:Cytochrome c n=1 Tax=Dyadobacter luteus TaxID=2259619 RepID=A0A3D8Y7G7_9BACT|nr:cytochrome c [Dyadobacter luteus]REA58811.1 cytochrome c [Dyadobacter luteus]